MTRACFKVLFCCVALALPAARVFAGSYVIDDFSTPDPAVLIDGSPLNVPAVHTDAIRTATVTQIAGNGTGTWIRVGNDRAFLGPVFESSNDSGRNSIVKVDWTLPVSTIPSGATNTNLRFWVIATDGNTIHVQWYLNNAPLASADVPGNTSMKNLDVPVTAAQLNAGGSLRVVITGSSSWDAAFGAASLVWTDPIDLTLAKSVTSTGPYAPGGAVTFTLNASNLGPGTAQPAIVVQDTLPAGLTFVGASGTDWTCGNAAQVITCTRSANAAALTSGAAASPITVSAKLSATASGILTNVAYVAPAASETALESNPVNASNGYDDGNPASGSNNDASAPVSVAAPPAAVPTLGQSALLLLSVLTALSMGAGLRRRA